jgi:hypothetical protein
MAQNNKKRMASFVVSTGDQALVAGGTTLSNNTTRAVNLANGQLSIFDATGDYSNTFNTALTAGDDVSDSGVIKIVQGNANSGDPDSAHVNATYPLPARPYEASQNIIANNVVAVTKQAAAAPTTAAWVVGQPNGTSGEIVASDNTEYQMEVAYSGPGVSNMIDRRAAAKTRFGYITPDFTTLATAEPRDYLIQNLVAVVNRNSKLISALSGSRAGNDLLFALAIDSTGAAGTDASTLVAGTVLPVINTISGVRNITLRADQATAIQAALAAAGFAAGSGILTVDTTTAGTVTGGVADGILLVALDRPTSFIDYKPQTKVNLTVGLPLGFATTTYKVQGSFPFEGHGQPRGLDLWYKSTHGQRRYWGRHEEFPIIEYPSPIDYATTYTTYIIEHTHNEQIDTANYVISPMREVVLVPDADTTTIAGFEAVLTPWLASVNKAIKTY